MFLIIHQEKKKTFIDFEEIRVIEMGSQYKDHKYYDEKECMYINIQLKNSRVGMGEDNKLFRVNVTIEDYDLVLSQIYYYDESMRALLKKEIKD